jgi:hypothetical protein
MLETLKRYIPHNACYNLHAFPNTIQQLIDKHILTVSLLWTIHRFYLFTLTSPSCALIHAPRQLRAFHYSYNDISLRANHYAPVLCYLSYCMTYSLLNFKKTTPLIVYSNSTSEQFFSFFINYMLYILYCTQPIPTTIGFVYLRASYCIHTFTSRFLLMPPSLSHWLLFACCHYTSFRVTRT